MKNNIILKRKFFINKTKKYYKSGTKNRKTFQEFLKGKKIAVVSGAPHLINSNEGEKIDSYDVVVRINQGYLVSINDKTEQKDIGSRTDILYTQLSDYPGCGNSMHMRSMKPYFKWIVSCSPYFTKRIKEFVKKTNKYKIPFYIVEKQNWDSLFNQLNLRPNKETPTSGMITIYHLLQYDIKELYVTGFTFYKNIANNSKDPFYYKGYFSGYRSDWYMYRGPGRSGRKNKKPPKQHPPNIEFIFFKELYSLNKDKISCDSKLLDLMERF